jgi:carboxyl-terminal processing protease
MVRHSYLVFTTLLVCSSLFSVSAAPIVKNITDFDTELEEKTEEIPVESIQKFVQIYGIVQDNYVQEKSDEELFQQVFKGLVGGLDKYSKYLSPEDYKQLVQYTEGDIAAVDFELEYNEKINQWVIKNLRKDGDSSKQGLRNDVSVFKIDGQELKKLNRDQVNNLLIGSFGTTLSIQLANNSQPFTLVRNKKIDTDIQANFLHNHVLVIKVRVFQQDTANQIQRLIDQYTDNGIKAVLLDLRNNPGGLLSSAVESADLFLNQGVIVSTKSRSEGDQQYQALPGYNYDHLKIGILINGRSASAAEVFTAALKEHGRAWVVGEKSYGKGVVQKLFPLSDRSALQMTVSHYYTPRGNMIEGKGIEPNYVYVLPYDMKDDTYTENVSELLLNHK